MRNSNCCNIWAKFGLEDNELLTSDHWTVLLRPKQVTVGSCVLIANRHIESLADLNDVEAQALRDIVARMEQLLDSKLHNDKINYLALMMKDPHLHFHVIPRYETNRTIEGRVWQDPSWPKAPNMSVSVSDPEALAEVRKYLRG